MKYGRLTALRNKLDSTGFLSEAEAGELIGYVSELRHALDRARVILRHMCMPSVGWWSLFTPWQISDQPLRIDAANALPQVKAALGMEDDA